MRPATLKLEGADTSPNHITKPITKPLSIYGQDEEGADQ